jgi:hypothetical protein
MTLEEGLSAAALLGVGAIGFLLRSLKSYVVEKGKNQATKEDIGSITAEVEKIKLDYARQQEALLQQNRL